MGKMLSRHKKSLIISLFLILVASFSYYNFNKFKPKAVLRENIKGYSTSRITEIPFPRNYKELASNQTTNGRQITIEVTETPQQIQDFYRHALLSLGWQVEFQGTSEPFLNTKFKNDGKSIIVTSSKQNRDGNEDKSTIVAIDINENREFSAEN